MVFTYLAGLSFSFGYIISVCYYYVLDVDGVFVSNGPGDPVICSATVDNLKKALDVKKPIFGICFGHQLLARAAGCDTYKLPYVGFYLCTFSMVGCIISIYTPYSWYYSVVLEMLVSFYIFC